MQKVITTVTAIFLFNIFLIAQPKSDSIYIIELNQQIDDKVISRNITSLDSLYSNDFIMTHGDGRRDTKTVWLTAVAKSNYSVRKHDSVKVEMHGTVAIAQGRMLVQKAGGETTAVPYRRYIRVFAVRNKRWQLLSHFTMYDK